MNVDHNCNVEGNITQYLIYVNLKSVVCIPTYNLNSKTSK